MPAGAWIRLTGGALRRRHHRARPAQPHGSHTAACRIVKGIAFVQGTLVFSQGGSSRRSPARMLLHTRMRRRQPVQSSQRLYHAKLPHFTTWAA